MKAGRGAVGHQELLSIIDVSPWLPRLRRFQEYPRENAYPGTTGKPVAKGVEETVTRGRILPSQPIVIDVDDPDEHHTVFRSFAASLVGKQRLTRQPLFGAQP